MAIGIVGSYVVSWVFCGASSSLERVLDIGVWVHGYIYPLAISELMFCFAHYDVFVL